MEDVAIFSKLLVAPFLCFGCNLFLAGFFVHRTTVEGRSCPLPLYCIRCRAGVGVNVLPCFVFFSLLLLRSNSPLVFVLESDFGGGVNEGICFRILSMGFLFWLSRKHSLVPRMPFVIPVWLHRSAVVSCHESVH